VRSDLLAGVARRDIQEREEGSVKTTEKKKENRSVTEPGRFVDKRTRRGNDSRGKGGRVGITMGFRTDGGGMMKV